MESSPLSPTRRHFLGASVTSASVTLVGAPLARLRAAGVAGGSKIRLGIVGCGRRGAWIGKLFLEHGGYELAACADYFEDRLAEYGEKFAVPASRRFGGLSGYRRLIESGAVDAVVIETPPYYHPRQVADAVAAGLHVYVAKPVAVDVPGCQSIAESGRRATAKRLCLLVDFQARVDPFMRDAMARVRAGALGDLAFGEAMYHCEDPFGRRDGVEELERDPGDAERRLRVWGLDKCLSGDIVVEQSIHTIDMLTWAMGGPPVTASATCGRKARRLGTSGDNFAALLDYGNGVGVTFSHRQINGHGTVPAGIRIRLFGSRGVLEAEYAGKSMIRGEAFFRGGDSRGQFKDGVVTNIGAFHEAIRAGRCDNATVEPSVQSNLVSLLVRKAAYGGAAVRWEELVRDAEVLDPRLEGLKG